jgi:SAM-dependent methyltransferase
MPANTHFDFGYPWWLSYGHLAFAAAVVAILLLGYFRKWSPWPMFGLAALTLWSGSAFVAVRFGFDVNAPPPLPAESFFRSGVGRVLDLGAGTGRSSIMLLRSRPQATLVALDLFGDSFNAHFGEGDSPQQRLLRNLKAAGVDNRATIQAADMRNLPFEAGAFDAVISSYAVDHLNRDGIRQTLGETARVLKPGGEFLLMVVNKDKWLRFTFGPLLFHGGTRGADWWSARLKEAGFQVLEEGTPPATLCLLARRP